MVDMEPEKEKALCIAMNKVGGQWDYGLLADIMEELRNSEIDTTATGFSGNEIAELLGELQEEAGDIPEVDGVGKRKIRRTEFLVSSESTSSVFLTDRIKT